MAATFAVDDVKRATDRLNTRRLAGVFDGALALGGDPQLEVVDHGGTHPLLGAVHLAFAEHRPLVLSPDAVWMTIAQGVAHQVRLHAETLRSRLVRHAGVAKLQVTCLELRRDTTSWARTVAQFRDALAAEIGDGRARLLSCGYDPQLFIAPQANQLRITRRSSVDRGSTGAGGINAGQWVSCIRMWVPAP